MVDRGKHSDTGKKSSSGLKIDLTRKLSQERSQSQRGDEKRNSATSSSKEAVRSKASSSDLVRKLDKLHISKRTEHQRPSGQRPTGTKFSREISRATSSSFPGRDARLQRKYDPLLRTQGRRLRGGTDSEESSEHNGGMTHEELVQFVDDLNRKYPELEEFKREVEDLTKKFIEEGKGTQKE
jgi:hypothetical protein